MANRSRGSYITLFGRKIHRAWLILVGCCFLQAGGVGAILLSVGVFYVPVCEDMGFARSEMSLWMTAYFLATIPATPLAGKLLTRFNVRVPMSISIIVVAIAIGLMSTYRYLWQWIASGAVIGVFGACVLMLPASVMVGNWFAKHAGLAMGVQACCSALSGAFLSPFFQSIIASFGWKVGYLAQATVVLVTCLPWALFVFKLRPQDVGALPYGLDPDYDHTEKRERKGVEKNDKPLATACDIPFRTAVGSASFVMLFLFACLSAFLGSGFDTHLPGIAESFGFSAAFGALLLSSLQIGSFVVKLVMGLLNDKIGVAKTVYIEFILMIIGIGGLLVLRQPVLVLVSAFLFGVQDSLISVSVPLLVRQMFGVENYVQLYALLRVGVGIFGSFASVVVGLSYDVTGSFVIALVGAMACAIVGFVFVASAYALRGRVLRKVQATEEGKA